MGLPSTSSFNYSSSNSPYNNSNMWQAAAIQGASSLLGSFVNWGMTASQNKKQRKWSEKMAEYAWNKDVEMWDMQNDYNSPAKQMERIKEAGLNPALMYQQGNVGNAGSMPSYNDISGNEVYGGFSPLEIPNFIGLYQDYQLKKENIDSIRKMNELRGQEIALNEYVLEEKGIDLEQKRWKIPYDRKAIETDLDRRLQETRKSVYDANWSQEKWDKWQESHGTWNIDDPFVFRMMGRYIDWILSNLPSVGKSRQERGPGPVEWLPENVTYE